MTFMELLIATVIKDLLDLEKSKIYTSLERVTKKYAPKIELEDLLLGLSSSIDDIIMDYAKKNGLNPLSGDIKVYFKENDTKKVCIYWRFYFTPINTNLGNKYQKIDSEKYINKDIFTELSIQKIQQGITYPIQSPNNQSR